MTSSKALSNWIPSQSHTQQDKERCVGIEIELANLSAADMAACIQTLYGGTLTSKTPFEYVVADTDLGDFVIELDSSLLKELAKEFKQIEACNPLERFSQESLQKIAEQLVPWEIVTDPMPLSKLHQLTTLFDSLRQAGALGTRHSIRYAFGLHLNPEIPNTSVDTVLAYLRAYLCLHEWISQRESVDSTRRLTTYINHFGKDYITKVIDPAYQPSMGELIDDYITFNPTRNRSLDMLPLFTHIDEARVRRQLDDPRIKARPTFHFRLPNCDIDNPSWNLDHPWFEWLQVEYLANNSAQLQDICARYRIELDRLTRAFDQQWADTLEQSVVQTDTSA